jgi:hypothetical protein
METPNTSPLSERRWRILISVFILFNLIAIPVGSTRPRAEQNVLQRLVLPYLRWTRLLQNWPLFVPSPRQNAIKYHVDIVFKDGHTATWQRPYPPNWDFFARHLSYSFQKWDLAANYLDEKGPLQRDLANYIQRLYWSDSNPPVTITLIRAMAKWPPPNETGYVRSDERMLQWTDHVVFTYHVNEQRMEP